MILVSSDNLSSSQTRTNLDTCHSEITDVVDSPSWLLNKEPDEVNKIVISPLFEIKKTEYGGRGCFSSQHLTKGTSILLTGMPIGSSMVRPFRKEVCTWCFAYDSGRKLKHRLEGKVYFCSNECLDEFNAYDISLILGSTLIAAEELYVKCEGEINEDQVPLENRLAQEIEIQWNNVLEWENQISELKNSKRHLFYPVVTAEDYVEIKYVITTLFSLYKSQLCIEGNSSGTLLLESDSSSNYLSHEVELFRLLQSSEDKKVTKYPYLLISYTNIYKFVRLVSPPCFLTFVTPSNIRGILGRSLTNAFGIWSPITAENEEQEFFGFGVYANASYFNHSCDPNIEKIRKGYKYQFLAARDISVGEELTISYGIRNSDDVVQRRNCLKEWFFTCGCTRCAEESEGNTN